MEAHFSRRWIGSPYGRVVPSDVDFLVEYPPGYDFGPWLGRFQDLECALATLLVRDVGLVMTSALRNTWFRQEAAKTRRVIYDTSQIMKVA